jgi:hypothetical protein
MTPPADQTPAGGDEAFTNSARSTVNISGELLAITRAAVRLVRARTGRAYSLRQFTEEAFATQIQTIAETYNEGRTIRPDDTPLEKGRSA